MSETDPAGELRSLVEDELSLLLLDPERPDEATSSVRLDIAEVPEELR
ncbi:hypothetical protein [Brachybacterium paraconglomeratum]|nr:hypothetical protein [Brachybacterium paraconglomeratum]MCT1436268.1 hypothetical protein [Brachybacterium paraconglomeratum]